MARYVVLPSLADLLVTDDDAACAFNEEAQHDLLMRPPAPFLPTSEERMAYAALFPPPVAEALGKRKRRERDVLLTMDELNAIAPVLDDEDDDALVIDEEDDEDEAPLLSCAEEEPPKKKAALLPRRANVLKADVQRAVEASDAEWLRAHALNVRQQPYEVYARSKFSLPVASAEHRAELKGLTTLRLAIYRVSVARGDAEKVEAALETLETLVTRCGLDPHDDEPRETLLAFVSEKADAYAAEEYRVEAWTSASARVLRAMLKGPKYLSEPEALREALWRLVETGREECVLEVVRARGERLADADVFELGTRLMLFGTHSMLQRTLQALDDADRLPPTLCHAKTRSTLLHFAAKRCDALEAIVRPFCDAECVDRRGRRAAHYRAARRVD